MKNIRKKEKITPGSNQYSYLRWGDLNFFLSMGTAAVGAGTAAVVKKRTAGNSRAVRDRTELDEHTLLNMSTAL